MTAREWPALSLAEWEPTYLTLHRWTQIVGKVRMAQAPWTNHWWHVPLYVSSQGLTTSSMPYDGRQLTLTFDFCAHRLVAHVSDKRTDSFALEPMSVAEFYDRTMGLLARLDVPVRIWPVPAEIVDRTPFREDRKHAAYDREQVEKLHRILMNVARVFAIHRGRFVGKSSPVHFFWGGFDLAVTRFSGRPNPNPPKDVINSEGYSHEVISHGFWLGGDWPLGGRVNEAMFYAYAVPEPPGFRNARVSPPEAKYVEKFGEYLLPYDVVRQAADPDGMLLEFMESTYLAGAKSAGWDIDALRHPRAAQLLQK
jgi:uncharacterized protein DUF5996